MSEHVLEGTVYVRPVGRGVVVVDSDVYVEDWLEEALGGSHRYAKIRLTLTVEDAWDQEDESRPNPHDKAPDACPPHGPDVVQSGHHIACGRCGEPISDEKAPPK